VVPATVPASVATGPRSPTNVTRGEEVDEATDPSVPLTGLDGDGRGRTGAPPVAAGVHVLWLRLAEPPPRRRRLRSRPSRARLIAPRSRLWISPLGHSLGQTLPYWAVSGPTPGPHGRNYFTEFAGISPLGSPANAMLHTQEVAGSKPAAPMRNPAFRRDRWGLVASFVGAFRASRGRRRCAPGRRRAPAGRRAGRSGPSIGGDAGVADL
jgi:hypothetical protein